MHINFDEHVRKIREHASERAKKAGHEEITISDLLHGLARNCPDLTIGLLDKLGLNLRPEAAEAPCSEAQATGGEAKQDDPQQDEQWDETCKKVFERAASKAEDAQEEAIRPEHLIMSLLSEARHGAESFFRKWVDPNNTATSGAVVLKIKQREDCRDLPLPRYMSEGASGMDLTAAVTEDTVLEPGKFMLVPTGLSVAVPPGYEAQVRPRSGLALKAGISVLNTPGTIDCDYRGEIGVILVNFSTSPFVITRGMRIAQMVISPIVQVRLQPADNLDDTIRGSSGFGASGV